MYKETITALTLAVAFTAAATETKAATFTYDFDFAYDISGDNASAGFRTQGPGERLRGFFTIDDTNQILDFDLDTTLVQRTDRFQGAQTDIIDLDIDDGDLFSTFEEVAGGGRGPFTTFSFTESTGLVSCSFRNAQAGRFGMSFRAEGFQAGDASVSFDARAYRSSPFCNQFGALTFDIRLPNQQTQLSLSGTGTLRTTNDPVSPVPLPAGAWLVLSALAGLGLLRKRRSI